VRELAACEAEPCSTFPGDGYGDGGAPLSYTDNGDGTFTDDNTGLMWEIKTDDDSIHDVDDEYTWTNDNAPPYAFNGTAKTQFLDALNGAGGFEGAEPFAGYTDWRLPTIKELQSLVAYSTYSPAVHEDFPGATATDVYWSSTSNANNENNAWNLSFNNGNVNNNGKNNDFHVRAVRGGR